MDTFPFPVLDLRDLDRGDEAAAAFRAQLLEATHKVGFFYLVGTGITHELENRLLSTVQEFFALPEEEKLKIENVKSPHFRGYTRLGGERTMGRVDWREQVDIWPENEPLPLKELSLLPPYMRLIGPNLWPEALPSLRAVVEEWQAAVVPAAHKLLRAWARALGADEDFFDRHFQEPSTRLKIVRYPHDPSVFQTSEEPVIGVGPHKDGGCVTMLWVQPGKGGLQVRPQENGPWVDAVPLEGVPGAFVCNIGEMIELATNGYLKATVHRVISQKDERISVPMFFNPSLDARFPTLRLPDHLAKHARGVTQHSEDKIHSLYGNNLLKSRLRAHPDVAAKYHQDLIASGIY